MVLFNMHVYNFFEKEIPLSKTTFKKSPGNNERISLKAREISIFFKITLSQAPDDIYFSQNKKMFTPTL